MIVIITATDQSNQAASRRHPGQPGSQAARQPFGRGGQGADRLLAQVDARGSPNLPLQPAPRTPLPNPPPEVLAQDVGGGAREAGAVVGRWA